MTIILYIFMTVTQIFLLIYFLGGIINYLRIKDYQKLWYKEKLMRLRATPRISNADLCEYYVMFCKRNDCKVEF